MKYIGNEPGLEIVNLGTDLADYVSPVNPAINTNPSTIPVSWFNNVTGEMFYCTSNSIGANIWIGQLGTTISP